MTLKELSAHVMSDFKTLQEFEIVARVMMFSGRKFSSARKGFAMLRDQKLIPDSFIDKKTAGIMDRMFEENPNLDELFERFDIQPLKLVPFKPDPNRPKDLPSPEWKLIHQKPVPLTPDIIAARIHATDLNF